MEATADLARTGPDPRRWLALALLCSAYFMVILDVSIVNVALPSIQEDLHFSPGDLQWVLSAYALTFGGFLLLGGRAADLLGRRVVFMSGVALFTLASLACGLSGSEGMLIAARAVQGLGAAILSPAALSIITTTFEEGSERNKALGIWGAMGGSGAAVGVLLGGILTKSLGWEWIFFVNVPVGAFVLATTRSIVRESRAGYATRHFDALGAVLITSALSCSSSPSPRRTASAGGRPRRSGSWSPRPRSTSPSSRWSTARRRRSSRSASSPGCAR